jgi:hypothetical protein
MMNIKKLQDSIKFLRKEAQSKHDTATQPELRAITLKIKALGAELDAAICSGAEPCETCGGSPSSLVQQVALKGELVDYYEVGCIVCPDHRAQGFAPGQAVEKWNEMRYLPAKAR